MIRPKIKALCVAFVCPILGCDSNAFIGDSTSPDAAVSPAEPADASVPAESDAARPEASVPADSDAARPWDGAWNCVGHLQQAVNRAQCCSGEHWISSTGLCYACSPDGFPATEDADCCSARHVTDRDGIMWCGTTVPSCTTESGGVCCPGWSYSDPCIPVFPLCDSPCSLSRKRSTPADACAGRGVCEHGWCK